MRTVVDNRERSSQVSHFFEQCGKAQLSFEKLDDYRAANWLFESNTRIDGVVGS